MLLEELTVGRAITNATWEILLQDQSISRPHARFERKNGKWTLYDLNSSNGTFVNATRVTGQVGHPLTEGDTITFGQLKLLFRMGMPPAGQTGNLNNSIPTVG
jgi:pSer/pThr/pTyr-binding forkhead associated (FHA) protein